MPVRSCCKFSRWRLWNLPKFSVRLRFHFWLSSPARDAFESLRHECLRTSCSQTEEPSTTLRNAPPPLSPPRLRSHHCTAEKPNHWHCLADFRTRCWNSLKEDAEDVSLSPPAADLFLRPVWRQGGWDGETRARQSRAGRQEKENECCNYIVGGGRRISSFFLSSGERIGGICSEADWRSAQQQQAAQTEEDKVSSSRTQWFVLQASEKFAQDAQGTVFTGSQEEKTQ